MVDILTYIVLVWVELTFGVVIAPLCIILAIGRYAKLPFVLHLLRTRYIVHYIRTTNGRLITQIALDKDVKTFGQTQFIPYKGFFYKINQSKFFLSGTDFAIAHKYNVAEPLDFSNSTDELFDDKTKDNPKYTAQETESAITSKVVLDLNKSIYTNKDILLIILVAMVGIVSTISLYFNYQNGQELAQLTNALAHFLGQTPAPTG